MELTTINTANYAEMAKAMGIAHEGIGERKQASTLARLRINHSPIIGTEKVLVKGGTYKLEIPDGPTYYAESVKIRPYVQRFMYKRFIRGDAGSSKRYVKTVMADNLNIDLKDNDGGFNCGKPAGFIKDWSAVPDKMKELIKSIKRVRVVLGMVELVNATDENGESVDVDDTAFIWEVENRDAFKIVGEVFTRLAKMKRLPVQHIITATSEERKIPTGAVFYLPTVSLDTTVSLDLTEKEQTMFADFMQWVQNYNEYIINAYAEKANHIEDDMEVDLDSIMDIEVEEVA